MIKPTQFLAALLALPVGLSPAHAQAVNVAQQVTLAGLRATNGQGAFPAAAYAPDGSLFLLYDQQDGARILKLDPTGANLVAQTQIGTAGDIPIALTLDPAGNVYIVGTSISASLTGTSGTTYPARADTTTNSFLAKFDTNLNTLFVTFLGAGRTSVTGVFATADAAFVTGLTFNPAFPATPNGIQQSPAPASSENGFAERFSTTGTLVYATYLTGANGSTAPAAIVADAQDNAYIAGYTSATGFPTIAALIPETLAPNSGFLTKLDPAGDGFLFSTFIPGNGITGLALDTTNQQLLLTGAIAPGQFPIATATAPIANTTYQSLLRIPLNGQTVTSSALLIPGTQSAVTAGPNGTAWITGPITTPLFPGTSQPLALFGDSFALHVTAANIIDQTLRFGGQPIAISGNSSLTSLPAAPAISPNGLSAAFPATLTMTVSPSLAVSQHFDLPTVQTPNTALPATLRDLAAACTGSSQCLQTAGYLTLVSTASAAPSLSISYDNASNLTLRNLGSATATGLVLMSSSPTISSNCGTTLDPSNTCNIALTNTAPGTLTASAANAATETVPLSANTLSPNPLAITPVELDFNTQTSLDPAATRTFTITNLSATSQTFTSALDASAHSTFPYTLTESSTDCSTNSAGSKTLPPNSACHVTLSLAAFSSPTNDGPIHAFWKIGTSDITLTGITQAAALTTSAAEVDFGTQFTNGLRLPRYLFLSNNSATPTPHAIATLSAPFTLQDDCPTTLNPHTVCRLTLNYQSAAAPSADATVLTLDQGLTVLVTGKTLPQPGITGTSTNPSLSVTPSSLTFATPVAVTNISATTQTVVLKNTGITPIALTANITGDFLLQNGCPANLPGGSSCQILVSFAPSQPGARQGLLAITGGSGFAPAYVTLNGTATPILPANNGTLDLGQTLVGEPAVAWFKVPQSLSSLTVATNSPAFNVAIVEDLGYGHGTLSPAAFTPTATGTCNNCYIGIQFLSQTPGLQAATLTLTIISTGKPYNLTLTATALPVTGLLLTPITQDFGPIPVNSSSSPHPFTLANLLAPTVTINSITTTGDFTVAPNTSGGQTCTTLAPAASCFTQIIFSPTATGPRTGTLTITTSAGTVTSTLTGNGLADPGLARNPTQLDFNNVPGTAALQQTITLSNTSTTPLTLTSIFSSDPAFLPSTNCSTLAPGALCTVTILFQPGFAPIAATLNISTTNTINGQTATTNYTAALNGLYTTEDAGLQLVPDVVNFGSTPVGALGVTRLFTLNNLTANTVAITLTLPRQFPLATPSPCPTLAPFASCTFPVLYLPATAGPATGTVFAQGTTTANAAPIQALAYMQAFGASTGTLNITGNLIPHSALNFGIPNSGQSSQQTLTLTNTATASLTIRRITSEPPFYSATTCGTALAPNASCAVTITYAPINQVANSTGTPPRTDAGTLMIESDAASSPDTIDLAGEVSPVTSSSTTNGATLAAFSLSQGALTFPATTVGNASAAQPVTLTNTGTTTLHILRNVTSPDFTATNNCTTLLPGDTCTYTIAFTPTNNSTTSNRTGTLEITTDAGTALEFVSLIGTSNPPTITLAPTALDFGTVTVGSSGELTVSVTNNAAAPITLTALTALTATGDYSAAYGNCPIAPATLAAGATCVLQITFTPTTGGTRTGTLSLSTTATTLPLTVSLSGNALITKLQISTGTLAFGTIAVGSPANLTLTLQNTGTSTVTNIAGFLSGPNAADFAVTIPCNVTALQPGQGCTETITFTPSTIGARSATLTLASSDPSSPATILLTGIGSAPGTFTLTVNGATSATATVKSGSPATYNLTLTSINGYTGAVALTCAPINPGTYASCSINPSTVTLNGAPQNSVVTINTITTATLDLPTHPSIFYALLCLPLLLIRRAHRLKNLALLIFVGIFTTAAITGCGGHTPPVENGIRNTPAGTYQYQVTATSTSGPQVTQTVTLNLIVQ